MRRRLLSEILWLGILIMEGILVHSYAEPMWFRGSNPGDDREEEDAHGRFAHMRWQESPREPERAVTAPEPMQKAARVEQEESTLGTITEVITHWLASAITDNTTIAGINMVASTPQWDLVAANSTSNEWSLVAATSTSNEQAQITSYATSIPNCGVQTNGRELNWVGQEEGPLHDLLFDGRTPMKLMTTFLRTDQEKLFDRFSIPITPILRERGLVNT